MLSQGRRALRVILRDLKLNVLLGSPLLPTKVRRIGLRTMGVHLGAWAQVRPRCFFGGTDISIGSEAIIGYGCFLDNAAPISIGTRSGLGMEVMLCTGTHEIGGPGQRVGVAYSRPIVIGDGCWLGTRSVVLPGVTIGNGCVISAGAVVSSDCEPNGLYAGVPARRVRELSA